MKHYSIDKDNKMYLNKKQMDKLVAFINKNDIINKIKDNLNSSGLVFPQKKEQMHHSFCNEEVYGKVNMLSVSGLLRMNYTYI